MKENPKNRLFAILFTDIEGYTLVSNQNQELGFQMARTHREVIQFCDALYGGKCINFYGDGSLSLFPDVEDAILCAIQMQREFRMKEDIPVRIGIHYGSVIVDGTSAYGDAVNIANRVQDIAPKGGILVTEAVYRKIGKHKQFRMIGIGSEQLKNIPYPIGLFHIEHPNVTTPQKGEVHRKARGNKRDKGTRPALTYILALTVAAMTALGSIFIENNRTLIPPEADPAKLAVMPFHNLTGIAEDSTIGKMATEHLIKGLLTLPGTDVVIFPMHSSSNPVDEAGMYSFGNVPRATHARNLILGKYFREGDTIIFKAEIIDLISGKYLHSFEPRKSLYTEPLTALAELEREITGFWANQEQKQ